MSDEPKPDAVPPAAPQAEQPSPFAGRIPGREDNFISVTRLCGLDKGGEHGAPRRRWRRRYE